MTHGELNENIVGFIGPWLLFPSMCNSLVAPTFTGLAILIELTGSH
jgi:hypothetical protein